MTTQIIIIVLTLYVFPAAYNTIIGMRNNKIDIGGFVDGLLTFFPVVNLITTIVILILKIRNKNYLS